MTPTTKKHTRTKIVIKTYAEATDPTSMCYGRLIYDPNMDEPKLTYNWTVAFECFKSEELHPRFIYAIVHDDIKGLIHNE